MAHINLTNTLQGTKTGDLVKPLSHNYSGLSVSCSADATVHIKCLGMSEFVPVEDGTLTANQGALFNIPLTTEIKIVPGDVGTPFTYFIGQF